MAPKYLNPLLQYPESAVGGLFGDRYKGVPVEVEGYYYEMLMDSRVTDFL